jgi:hypothetical protein
MVRRTTPRGAAIRRVFLQHNTKFALPECPLIHYISNQDYNTRRAALRPKGDGYLW